METIYHQAQEWVQWDPCEQTKVEVQKMLKEKDDAGLKKAFEKRVAFGTAGLRAEMGPGYSRLSDLVIIQTAQGLLRYVEKTIGLPKMQKKGIVLGFDHRKNGTLTSRRFALLTAYVFLSKDVKVYLYKDMMATPFVPYGVKHFKASCGVMVTASHNPRKDNGFKVYWGNACQIVSPHDAGIAATILRNLKPWEPIENYRQIIEKKVHKKSLCVNPEKEVMDAYFDEIPQKFCHHKEDNNKPNSSVKVCYTAMHGVGHRFAKIIFNRFGFDKFTPVENQVEPDPTFKTVAFPNPEEKGALDIACARGQKCGADLVMANDPDADRLAVAEKKADGTYRVFKGNEIGTLLGYWQWINYKKEHENDTKKGKGAAVVASTVSSKFLRRIGEVEGFHFSECLTGFKWIGNTSIDLEKQGYDVIFGYEEAIGFCIYGVDKDGISAIAAFAEMAGQLKKEGKTCAQQLDALEAKYGAFVSNNGYVMSDDVNKNAAVFTKLRANGKYIHSVGVNGKYKIKDIRDLTLPGYDSSKPDKKPTLPMSTANMLTFTFENGCVATLRMSGTEPKLKYYTELSGMGREKVTAELDDLVETGIRGDMLKELIASMQK